MMGGLAPVHPVAAPGGHRGGPPLAGSNRPARKPNRVIRCAECGDRHETDRLDATFCSRACKKVSENREARAGRRLYRLVLDWRRTRGKSNDVTNFGDRLVAEANARERARKARIAAARDVEAGRTVVEGPAAYDVVGTANAPLGTVRLEQEGECIGWRFHPLGDWRLDADAGDRGGYLAPRPEEALGYRAGAPAWKAPHVRLFPAGQAPADIRENRQ